MPPTMTGAFLAEAMKLHTASSWIDLWEIRTTTGDPTPAYLICANPYPVSFNGRTYSPFPVERTEDSEDTEGGIPELTLTVANIDRAIQVAIAAGLRGKTAIMRKVNTATLGTAAAVLTYRYTILSADCSDVAATFKLGVANPVTRDFPGRRYQRNRCDLDYGGALCGYNTTRSGALVSCDRTLLGSNGCRIHGDDEQAAGIPRQHAQNYGGEPAIPRGPFL